MSLVEVVPVVDVVECDVGVSEDVERPDVLVAELGRDVDCVYKDGRAAFNAVAEAVQDLVARRMLEVPV